MPGGQGQGHSRRVFAAEGQVPVCWKFLGRMGRVPFSTGSQQVPAILFGRQVRAPARGGALWVTSVQVETRCGPVSPSWQQRIQATPQLHVVSCSLGVAQRPVHSLQKEASPLMGAKGTTLLLLPTVVPSGTAGGSAGCSGGVDRIG